MSAQVSGLTSRLPAGLAGIACASLGLWLGFPSDLPSLPLLCLLYPAGLALLSRHARSWRSALLWGWAAGIPGHFAALYWLALPLSQVGGLPLLAAVPLALLVCCGLSIQCAVFTLFCWRFWQPRLLSSGLAMGLAWHLAEHGFALAFGFPWLPLAGALAAQPLLVQTAGFAGAFLTSGFWAMAALLAAGSMLGGGLRSAGAAAVLALVLAGYGWHALAKAPFEAAPTGPGSFPVLMVEGNIDQNQKWGEAYQQSTVDAYTSLTERACAEARVAGAADLDQGLIVWPETAMPFDVTRSRHAGRIQACVLACGMPLVTGEPGLEITRQGKRVYNRTQLISAEGYPAGHYDKEHLVPFGEYVPPFLNWEFLAPLLQEVGAYTPGRSATPLRTGRLVMGALVCYEGIFPWLAQARAAQGANLLLDISNDGWFGATPAPRQHLYLTSLRCIEQKRWLVRGTNTGISAVVDANGRIAFAGDQFKAQALWARARTESAPSLYAAAHPFIPPLSCALLGLLLWRQYRKTERHASAE